VSSGVLFVQVVKKMCHLA